MTNVSRWRLPAISGVCLGVVVLLRGGLQAIFVPVWEGPDEPAHASRIAAFASFPFDRLS